MPHAPVSESDEDDGSEGEGSEDGTGEDEGSDGVADGSEGVVDGSGEPEGPVGVGSGRVGHSGSSGVTEQSGLCVSPTRGEENTEPPDSEKEANDGCGPIAAHETEDGAENATSAKKNAERVHARFNARRTCAPVPAGPPGDPRDAESSGSSRRSTSSSDAHKARRDHR